MRLQSVENLPTVFGSNSKAQTAAKTVFDLAHRHGNILREGWKNIMDSMLQLFRAELLPKAMVEVRAPFLKFSNVLLHSVKRLDNALLVQLEDGTASVVVVPG